MTKQEELFIESIKNKIQKYSIPTTVKETIEEGKRVKKMVKKINKNKKGITGGDFDKFDMLESIYDGNVSNPMLETLILYKDQLLSMSSIKKPVEDLVDAILLNLITEKKLIENDDVVDKIEY